ncbi:hypothetical protein HID58_021878 [Brassica napus]|uniref:ZF-HD dimerization-type domain-containing protein n=1 Tax=Brassica napus TaxID=3708 RepID=A0ABQ8CXM2_BRANA|nr:hypothetical protein HID58_021878 [Brassica napus]
MKKRQVVIKQRKISYTTTTSSSNVRYVECQKNHAANIGGYAVDGCREFMARGGEGTDDALTCAACGCHRNFHRREVETEVVCESFVKASKSDDEFCSAPSITESDEKPKPIYWKSHESNTLSFTPPRLVIYRIKLPGPAILGETISIVQFVFVIVVLLPVNKRGLLHSPKTDLCQKVSSFELDDSLVHCVLPRFEKMEYFKERKFAENVVKKSVKSLVISHELV